MKKKRKSKRYKKEDDLELDSINDLGYTPRTLRGRNLTIKIGDMMIGKGEMIFDNGILVYADDGKGNQWAIDDEDDFSYGSEADIF